MRILPFKIPKGNESEIYIQEDSGATFYSRLHNHPEIQLTLIIEGKGTIILGDYLGTFEPGEVYWIGSNIPHVFRDNNTGIVHSVSIFLDPKFLKNPIIKKEGSFSEKLSSMKDSGVLMDSLSPYDRDIFKQLPSHSGIKSTIQTLGILEKLVSKPVEIKTGKINNSILKEKEGDRLSTVFEYAFENYLNEINLNRVASKANMSKSAFCRYFKNSTGKTYYDMVIDLRIAHAAELLRDRDLPIYRIAMESGFNNLANFNRRFRLKKNITPREFRKTVLNEYT